MLGTTLKHGPVSSSSAGCSQHFFSTRLRAKGRLLVGHAAQAKLAAIQQAPQCGPPRGCGGVETTPIFGCVVVETPARLATEAVQGPALPLQGIHHIKSGDSLAPGVLSVGDCVPDDVLQEHLQEQGASTQRNCCYGCHAVFAMTMKWCAGVNKDLHTRALGSPTQDKQAYLEDTTGLLVDEARDALDTPTAGQPADGRLGDALDVVTQQLAVPLGASLAQALASLATARHSCCCW